MKTRLLVKVFLAACLFLGLASVSYSETQGVSDTEIVLGSHNALSGPVAGWGIPIVRALRIRFEEANANGGIHGRKIRLVAEDSQYQVPIAVQKANKLINRDKVFGLVASIGSPMNNAVFKFQFKKDVPSLFPATHSRSMIEPFNKLKFMANATYYDSMRAATRYYVEVKGKKRVGVMAIDSDHGMETVDGVTDQLQAMGMEVAAMTLHKATETNFVSSITKLRNAGCDVVMLGTIIKDTIIAVTTARKLGWEVEFVGNGAVCSSIVTKMGGPMVEGLVGVNILDMLPETPKTEQGRLFVEKYQKQYNTLPNEGAVAAYAYMDILIKGMENAGRNLTVESLVKGIESIKGYESPFIAPVRNYSAENHQGHNKSWLLVVKNNKWVLPEGKIEYLTY